MYAKYYLSRDVLIILWPTITDKIDNLRRKLAEDFLHLKTTAGV